VRSCAASPTRPLPAEFLLAKLFPTGRQVLSAKLGLLALGTTGAMAMGLLPEPVIQVVDPDTGRAVGPGEVGEVVVTNYSRAYPLIRFGTGDMAVNVDPNPGESLQEERSIILVGRRGEAVKVRGMFVHPNQLRFAVAPFPDVNAIQGIVTRPENRDYLVLRVVASESSDQEALIEQLKASVTAACRVSVDEIDFVAAEAIPPGAPGMVDEREWT
jgi:phenylacetate-CoA ligase